MNAPQQPPRPAVGIVMGSQSDWPTMERATELLEVERGSIMLLNEAEQTLRIRVAKGIEDEIVEAMQRVIGTQRFILGPVVEELESRSLPVEDDRKKIEHVATIGGVAFYNDSKATNRPRSGSAARCCSIARARRWARPTPARSG